MAYLLPSGSNNDAQQAQVTQSDQDPTLTDLKVFWGPDICRLEYLVHLLDTGRIKEEWFPAAARSL